MLGYSLEPVLRKFTKIVSFQFIGTKSDYFQSVDPIGGIVQQWQVFPKNTEPLGSVQNLLLGNMLPCHPAGWLINLISTIV